MFPYKLVLIIIPLMCVFKYHLNELLQILHVHKALFRVSVFRWVHSTFYRNRYRIFRFRMKRRLQISKAPHKNHKNLVSFCFLLILLISDSNLFNFSIFWNTILGENSRTGSFSDKVLTVDPKEKVAEINLRISKSSKVTSEVKYIKIILCIKCC